MFLLSLYILVIVINFSFPKSRLMYVIDFFFMWVLMGWNHNVADYNIYLKRYTNPEIFGTLEPLYIVLQNIGKSIGLEYKTFLVIMTCIFLLIRMSAIRLLSEKPNIVIGMYLLFPFVMDITQIRMFYATTLILIGLVFLLIDSRKGIVIYIIMTLLAASIHSSCIFYLLFVIAKYIDKSKVKKYSKQLVILIVIAYLLLFTGSLYTMAKTVLSIFGYGTKFVETVYATSQAYKITHKITYMMEIGLFFVFFNYIFSRAVRKYKNSIRTNKMIETENNMSLMIFCYKVNYILLLILPLAWFSGDIYRIQHGILILFYSAFSNSNYMYSKKKAGITLYQLAIILFIAVFMLLFLIGLSSLRETVFMPVFFENELIG